MENNGIVSYPVNQFKLSSKDKVYELLDNKRQELIDLQRQDFPFSNDQLHLLIKDKIHRCKGDIALLERMLNDNE